MYKKAHTYLLSDQSLLTTHGSDKETSCFDVIGSPYKAPTFFPLGHVETQTALAYK